MMSSDRCITGYVVPVDQRKISLMDVVMLLRQKIIIVEVDDTVTST